MSDPIKTTVVRYKCPHCNRHFSRKKACAAHIERCFLDPANRTCRTCEHHHWEDPFRDTQELCSVSMPKEFPVVLCPLWELASERAA